MWWTEQSFELVFDPGVSTAHAGCLLVGLGDPHQRDLHQREQHPHELIAQTEGIALNHKPLDDVQTLHRFSSVCEYVGSADDGLIDSWRMRLPDGPASLRRIVVEDLSLDTCLALLLFFDRTGHNRLVSTELEAWVRYVTDWEAGLYADSVEMRHSAAVQMTILGHSYLSPTPPRGVPDESLRTGLRACLSLLRAMIDSGMSPHAPVPRLNTAEHSRAMAQFEYEAQQYRLALAYGRSCQLLVPLADGGRRVLIDALILDEVEPSGILKLFARTDLERSWTRKGFALLAIHRPSQAGTGNDMTLSIDPATGLTLRDLWVELERRENLAWGEDRPRDWPRRIASYRRPDGTVDPAAPNEPWWDDSGRYTLIGAPKRLLPHRQGPTEVEPKAGQTRPMSGSRLQWRADVLSALWKLYGPVPAEAHVLESPAIGVKRLAMVRWESGPNLAVAESPSFHAWLASHSMARRVESPLDLPLPDEFELQRAAGGLAAIHREGVTLFDDWRQTAFDLKGLQNVAVEIGAASAQQRAFLDQKPNPLEAALAQQERLIRGEERFTLRRLLLWKHQMSVHRHALLKILSLAIDKAEGREHASFRQGLIRHWGLSQQREHMLDMLHKLEELTQHVFADTGERQRRLMTALITGIGGAVSIYHAAEALGKEHARELLRQALINLHVLANEAHFASPDAWQNFWASAGLAGAGLALVASMLGYLWWGKAVLKE